MDKYKELERRIKELENWKKEKTSQQIIFPLDAKSIDVLQKHFMRIVSTIEYFAGAGGNRFLTYLGMQDTTLFEVGPPTLISYSVNTTTDIFTTNQLSGNIKFFDDSEVVLNTDDTAPAPLDATLGTVYYVINSDGYSFQLSATLGGAAINVTTTGSGRQFISHA